MFRAPDYYHNVSLHLSEVLDDIGVSDVMVLKRRRAMLINENVFNLTSRLTRTPVTSHFFGSQSEGSTTTGLKSDCDVLAGLHCVNAIQTWEDWTAGTRNMLMVQDETTAPGYCILQITRRDVPLPLDERTAAISSETHVDTLGRFLWNCPLKKVIQKIVGGTLDGPSIAHTNIPGYKDSDYVIAFHCKSWPRECRSWLQSQRNAWPPGEIRRRAEESGCFIVHVDSKRSQYFDCEWRISTSMAERYLMFSLNITQIRCYVLMKMILKTFIKPNFPNTISSYMCKTVLFRCISATHFDYWRENNVLSCLKFCLGKLYLFVDGGNCPHYILPANNLLAEKLTPAVKRRLREHMKDLLESEGTILHMIAIDDLGRRLQAKLNMINANVRSSYLLKADLSLEMLISTSLTVNPCYHVTIFALNLFPPPFAILSLRQFIIDIFGIIQDGTDFEKIAAKLLLPLYCTELGSVIASLTIGVNQVVCPTALNMFLLGLNSDVSSSRLKLASAFYCAGDFHRTLMLLNDIEQRYDLNVVKPMCKCFQMRLTGDFSWFAVVSCCGNEEMISRTIAYHVCFLKSEINCIPRELQYELYRSTVADMPYRYFGDITWMDMAVVDSLPYLYFLQYKTYGNLRREGRKQQALNNLIRTAHTVENIKHRETAFNLLGQCMEQENRHADAFQCYVTSLNIRPRNNAARVHICRLLAIVANVVNR